MDGKGIVGTDSVITRIADYQLCTTAIFFSWLKHQNHPARGNGSCLKAVGKCQKHGHMTIMPAQMRLSRGGGDPVTFIHFSYGKGIEFSAEQ